MSLDDSSFPCPECGRPIHGLTGLDELQNLIAHYQEHHYRTFGLAEAAELRDEALRGSV